jgi:F-type H+-transporting ATPase subunit alpha
LAEQVAILWAANNGYLDKLPIDEIDKFETKLLETLKLKGKKWVEKINKNKVMDEKDGKELEKMIKEI